MANDVTIEDRLAQVERTLRKLDPKQMQRFLRDLTEDANDLKGRLEILNLKQTVLSEVSRAVRQAAPDKSLRIQQTLIEMLDNDDAWWKARAKLVIKQWIELVQSGGAH